MKLAEEIIITLAGEDIELRPSLRLAIQLERRPGSFRQLIREIHEGSLTAAVDIIAPHYFGPFLANRTLDELPRITTALLAYVMACAGIEPQTDAASENSKGGKAGKTQSFADYLAQLYRYGSGWIGWTPEQTLDSTPLEITQAYAGKLEMLTAIYGTSEKAKPTDDRPLDDKFRSVFASIGTVKEAEAS